MIIAVSDKKRLTVDQMAIIVASLAWLNPARTIRAQVLSLRERGYVEVARLSGMSGPEIIVKELMPNLLPYLAATLVNTVSSAILASVGLEVLGLGPIDSPTLGMTLYWVNFNAALINGWWWWWTAPLAIILVVFLGLFFLTVRLDEIANPRLARIALIPQGSMNSLNPVMRIKDQISDALRDHGLAPSRRQVEERVRDLLESVGLRPEVADMFPHELSGGMKQRACIAIAISLRPRVIIADEPTSALDVVVQKQVMETLARVQEDLGASVILVGHDMGLMAQFVDRLGVMYAGRLIEVSPVRDIFTQPLHPYTEMLIASLPSLEQKGTFRGIPGLIPLLRDLPPGCAFHPRCPHAVDRCRVEEPRLREIRPAGWAACHLR